MFSKSLQKRQNCLNKLLVAIVVLISFCLQEIESNNNLRSSSTTLSEENNSISAPKLSENPLVSKIAQMDRKEEKLENKKWFRLLQDEISSQAIRQQLSEKDHSVMQQWLIDNINDLHRELKQTEVDFEHYVQVTKNLLAVSERKFQKLSRERQLGGHQIAFLESPEVDTRERKTLRALILE